MADTALERYKKDVQQKEQAEKTKPGEIRTLNEFQSSFLKALENIGEPQKPVKYFKPVKEAFKDVKEAKDTSILRFGLFLDPALRFNVQSSLNKKMKEEGKPNVDIMQMLESKDEKDYISGWDEIRKGVEGGSYDLGVSLGTILFGGTDLLANTDFLTNFEDFMKDKEPSRPETWRGDLTSLLVQFGVPGGLIQKVINRTKTAGKIKKAIEGIKGSKTRKVATIAQRAIEGATVVGATDFLASEPGRKSLFFEPESTSGLTGRERAAAEFRNKIKYGQEGAIVGFGFPLIGKGMQLGYKYGLAPFVKTTASLGAKGINNAVFRPISYIASRDSVAPVVSGGAKLIRNATNFTLTKAIAPAIVSTFSGKVVRQLPPFEQWRLRDIDSPLREERVIKTLDNILSYIRSFGKAPKDIEGISEKVMLFIKGRAKKLDRTYEGLERKAYDLAKKFENNYNKASGSPALQKHYLDKVEDFLKGQLKKDDLEEELRPLAEDLKNEIKKTMSEFKKMLPKGKQADKIVKSLENVEVNNIRSYLVKSFSTFTNPNYVPDEKIYNDAVSWVADNIVRKNKDLRELARKDFAAKSVDESYKESAKMMVEAILRAGRAEGKNPLMQLKEIAQMLRFKDYKFLKTGEELPTAIKNLLGPEKNLKASVSFTTSEMISAMANKKAADIIAQSGLKNGWLFRSIDEARNNRILSADKINKMPRLGPYMKSDLTELYAASDFVQMFQGVGGTLDNLMTIPIYRMLMQGKVGVQIGKTLYSPQTQVRNVSSAAFFALMNGHIGGQASVTNAMKIVLDDIFKAGQKNIDEVEFNNYVERLVRLGVWDENVVASELKSILDQIKKNTINTTDKLFDKLIKSAPTDKVARLYAGGDNLWKHFGFEYGRSQLNMALKNIDDVKAWYRDMGEEFLERNPVTGALKNFDDHIDDASAYLLRNTYPTYSKVPPAIQELRKIPIGTFISFPSEILRTGANIINIGLKETSSKNAAIRQMGLRRLMGAFMTSYAAGTGLVQLAQFLTNSTDAQWDAYKRSSAAPWDANANLLAIEGWKDGEAAAINFSYFSPYDSLWAPLEAAIAQASKQKLNPQETEEYVLNLMFAEDGPVMKFLNPFITEPLGYDRVLDVTVRNGKKDQGGTVYSPSDNLGDKFIKSFTYILDGVQPGVTSSGQKIAGSIGKDLTKGGKPLNLKDELLALFAGIRIIRIDTKKDLRYFSSEMNRLLRAVDENENFYNVDTYRQNTPNDMVETFKNMQDEAFKIQKDMYIRVKDLQLLDLDDDTIKEIMVDSGVNKKLAGAIMDGEFTPVNYSKARFESKIRVIEDELAKDIGKFKFRLNEDFVFPEYELDDVIDEYEDKPFFKETYDKENKQFVGGYYPEKFDYKTDEKGFLLKDENGDPIRDDGFIKRSLRKVSPIIKKGFNKLINPLSDDFSMQTPPLPNTPMPKVQMASNINPTTGLTQTQEALLSPSEQVIAKRNRTV
jgi:hypothetical protein